MKQLGKIGGAIAFASFLFCTTACASQRVLIPINPTTRLLSAADVPPDIKSMLEKFEKMRIEQEKSLLQSIRETNARVSDLRSHRKGGEAATAQRFIDSYQTELKSVRALKGRFIPNVFGSERGEIMNVTLGFAVLQVISERELLVMQSDHRYWIQGVKTNGIVDDDVVAFPKQAMVAGTHQYLSTPGAIQTILVIEPFDLVPYQDAVVKPAK